MDARFKPAHDEGTKVFNLTRVSSND